MPTIVVSIGLESPLWVITRLSHFSNITVTLGGIPDVNRHKADIAVLCRLGQRHTDNQVQVIPELQLGAYPGL